MYKNHKISLVIPCLNEEDGLKHILPKMPKFLDEVIVVDNGSTDGSATVAEKLGARVIHESRKGYGSAYLAGVPAATGDIVVTMDGDASYSSEDIESMLKPIVEDAADFVSGSRFPLKDQVAMPLLNQIGNFGLTLIANILFWTWMKDSQSGMWAFWKKVYVDIEPTSTGMAYSQELKIRAALNNKIRFVEVPISYHPRVGEVKLSWFKDGVRNLTGLLQVRFKKNKK